MNASVSMKFTHLEKSKFIVDVPHAQSNLESFVAQKNVDVVFVTSSDAYLSEYNVPENNQRIALSNFSGSMGDGFFISKKMADALDMQQQFILFVDGRYHLQSDKECNPIFVSVVKVNLNQSVDNAMTEWLKEKVPSGTSVGIDASRFSWGRFKRLQTTCAAKKLSLVTFLENEISGALKLPGWNIDRPISAVSEMATGRNVIRNLAAIQNSLPNSFTKHQTCILTCASDDLSFLLNARGYHMPYLSSALGYTFSIGNDIVLFLPEGVDRSPVKVNAQEISPDGQYKLIVVRRDFRELEKVLSEYTDVKCIFFQSGVTNTFLPQFAQKIWPQAHIDDSFDNLEKTRVAKTPQELKSIKDAFMRSSRAIAATLRWAKSATTLKDGETTSDEQFKAPISEFDLSMKISKEYANQGAVELSFNSIAGTGENSAIIHYSTPQKDNKLAPGQIALLDSGAYYSEGFATDCTRTIFCGNTGKPEAWQTEIYSLTLKACLVGMMAEFPVDTPCIEIDKKVRAVCQAKGYDYNHGTSHGIGIHVHENGVRISTTSTYNFTEHAVLSMEPGIYLGGRGGVRIENVVTVKKLAHKPEHFGFENIVFVGYDWDLIDQSLFTSEELAYLKEYETNCVRLGTQVTRCPLL